MGLHANIHQQRQSAVITLAGQLGSAGMLQLRSVISHLHNRGCRQFVLDLSHVAGITARQRRQLAALIGQPLALPSASSSAIRLPADTSAARPQPGCGGPSSLCA